MNLCTGRASPIGLGRSSPSLHPQPHSPSSHPQLHSSTALPGTPPWPGAACLPTPPCCLGPTLVGSASTAAHCQQPALHQDTCHGPHCLLVVSTHHSEWSNSQMNSWLTIEWPPEGKICLLSFYYIVYILLISFFFQRTLLIIFFFKLLCKSTSRNYLYMAKDTKV